MTASATLLSFALPSLRVSSAYQVSRGEARNVNITLTSCQLQAERQ